MAIDSRLLPRGFVWAVAIAVVYTAVSILVFGFYYDLAAMAGFIFAALLAAVHTHLHESAPPAKGGGFFRMWWLWWPGCFWLWLFICIFATVSTLVPEWRPLAAHWLKAPGIFLVAFAMAWAGVRMPFIERAGRISVEKLIFGIHLVFGIIVFQLPVYYSSVPIFGSVLGAVAGIFAIYVHYLYRKGKENLQ